MKSFKIVLIALALTVAIAGMAQVPEKPDSMMPVIDMAGIIKNDSLVNALNTRLDSLSRRTTNQIVVVTVNDLGNLEANQFATQLGKKWGIGDKKHNNGMLILVKPRNDKGAGEVYIAPGGGLQGALPDVKCRWIIDSIMVPHLKQGDYASGIEAAIDHIEPIVLEEYEQEQVAATQNNKDSKGGGPAPKSWLSRQTLPRKNRQSRKKPRLQMNRRHLLKKCQKNRMLRNPPRKKPKTKRKRTTITTTLNLANPRLTNTNTVAETLTAAVLEQNSNNTL